MHPGKGLQAYLGNYAKVSFIYITTKCKQVVCSYIIIVNSNIHSILMAPLQEIHNGVKPRKSYLKERTNCRPGPKPKPLHERKYKPPKPIKRIERSYSRERKIEVILFRQHHRVQSIDLDTGLIVYLPPTFLQMADFWKIPSETIRDWWRSRETIINSKVGTRQAQTTWICTWPDMEKKLYTKLVQRRTEGILVRQSWSRRESRQL